MCAYCTCAVHIQTHFTTLCWWWLHSSCLLNPCQSDILWLTATRRNFYQLLLVRIYRKCAIVEVWLPFMMCRICNLRTLLSGWSFLFMIQANCGSSHCSHCKHHIYTWLSWRWIPPPPSTLRWRLLTLITTPTSILNDIILLMETERNTKACCWGE